MARQKPNPQAVEAEVAALGDLDLVAIREKWRTLFGNPPPKSLRHAFLVKACAYGIRTKAFGGLSAATKRRLREIAEAARLGKPTPSAPVRTKAGTRLIRAWGGKTHVVTVVAGGFDYEAKTYKSLSAIAGAITGTSWNGRTFFGVARPIAKADNNETPHTRGVSAAQAAPRGKLTPGGADAPDEAISQHASHSADANVELEAKGHV